MINNISSTEIIRELGVRFRDYRMRLNMTRKDVSELTAISPNMGMYPKLQQAIASNNTDWQTQLVSELLR